MVTLHPTEILPESFSVIPPDSLLYPFSPSPVPGQQSGRGDGGILIPLTYVRVTIITVIDNAGLDRAVIYVQTGGERIIYLGGDKRREIEEVFDIGDLLRLIHGGYDVRVNVTDINGNWATGKTHIDSALQTLKKGLSALLDMIVAALKVIAKVASMLIDIINKIIRKMLKPVMSPIIAGIENYLNKIMAAFMRISLRLLDSNEHTISIDDLQYLDATVCGNFYNIIIILFIAIDVVSLLIAPYTSVCPVLISLASSTLMNIIITRLASETVSGDTEILNADTIQQSIEEYIVDSIERFLDIPALQLETRGQDIDEYADKATKLTIIVLGLQVLYLVYKYKKLTGSSTTLIKAKKALAFSVVLSVISIGFSHLALKTHHSKTPGEPQNTDDPFYESDLTVYRCNNQSRNVRAFRQFAISLVASIVSTGIALLNLIKERKGVGGLGKFLLFIILSLSVISLYYSLRVAKTLFTIQAG